MFTVTKNPIGNGILEEREEIYTGLRCRISPERLTRGLDTGYNPLPSGKGCPFCPDAIYGVTPAFPDGKRIEIGESVTFPNLFPFAERHTVTVITTKHQVSHFSKKQLIDALTGQYQSLIGIRGYQSINWNYLASAGASLVHPHLQGLVDRRPAPLAERYLTGSARYIRTLGKSYWDDLVAHERESERFLFEKGGIFWHAAGVPLGEREVRGVIPAASLEEFPPFIEPFAEGLLEIIGLYRKLGTHAFNISLFFNSEPGPGFRAFCSVISRINPNSMSISDSAFMERIHLEPVILTLPEELGNYYRKEK